MDKQIPPLSKDFTNVIPDGNTTNNGNSFSSSIIDFTSPFYFANNNNPGNILVSHILEGENYPQWSRSMTIALSVKNKLSFVDKIVDSISYETTVQSMWDDMKDRFSQNIAPRLFKLRRDLILVSQDSSTISAYYTKFKSLWEELASHTPLLPCYCGLFISIDKPKGPRKQWPKCGHCGWVCHTINTCFDLHGYPPSHQFHQPGKGTSSKPTINEKNIVVVNSSQSSPQFIQDQYHHLFSMLPEGNAQPTVNFAGNSTSSPSSIPLHIWIVDTCASDHMSFDTPLFHSSTQVSHSTCKTSK
ncbi:hypothetical protein AMTRI_Chr06g195650 [Amborella trichopoda]